MVFRYAIVVVLVSLSLCAVLMVGATTGQALLTRLGPSAAPGYGLWALAAVAGLSFLSICRFMIFSMPSMLIDWCHDYRDWIGTLFLGGLVLFVFCWL